MIVAAFFALYLMFMVGRVEKATGNSAAEKATADICRKLAKGTNTDRNVARQLCD